MSMSYHDVVCEYEDADGKTVRVEMGKCYGYELYCNKVTGWQLRWVTSTQNKKIAGEYDGPKLRITVKGVRIL